MLAEVDCRQCPGKRQVMHGTLLSSCWRPSMVSYELAADKVGATIPEE